MAQADKDASYYTCPMHPEVHESEPVPCPLCGMALELAGAGVSDQADTSEYDDMRRRLCVALLFTLPVFALAMGEMLPGDPLSKLATMQLRVWLQLALATPVIAWCAQPFFVRGWLSLKTRHLNMFTLVALGTGTAYLYSLVALLAGARLPAAV